MSFDLSGKVVFVTGATSGLGRQFALALADAGAAVAVAGRRRERLDALVAEIEGKGGRAHAVALDVTDLSAHAGAIAEAEDALGPLWALVNNSGVSNTRGVLDQTAEDYDFIMNTNVKAAYFLSQAAARGMIERGGGRIVNIASIGAFKPLGYTSIYCMSKAAVAHMTRCMALEWARHNVNVNAICPGYIRTELNDEFFSSPAGEKMISRLPRRRLGETTDLNGLLLLLVSDAESRFITGSLMTADDGQSL